MTDPYRLDRPVRRGNLGVILRTLRRHGALSRAQLAARSGLAKSTVSGLVDDLGRRRLVHETGAAPSGNGRPGQLVALHPASAVGIGLDVTAGHLGVRAASLTGAVLYESSVRCDVPALGPERTLDQLTELVTTAARGTDAVAHVTVALPGLVDATMGTVTFAPQLRWRQVALADELAARTDLRLEQLTVDNEANLAALAEHQALAAAGVDGAGDLVYLSGGTGVGGAVVCGGGVVHGSRGFAGEVGHLTVDALGPGCSCGRRGCLETRAGLGALVHACSGPDDPLRDPALPVGELARMLRGRAARGDRRTLDALDQVGTALGVGVSALVTLLNPSIVVLGGYFAELADWLAVPVRNQLAAHALAPSAEAVTVLASRLGPQPSAAAAAAASVRRVFDDPTVVAEEVPR